MSLSMPLTIREVNFAYGNKYALKQVSFIANSGQCTILLGPNGAGKSTLFALITRLYDTPQGLIELGGFNIKTQTGKALRHLGVVFQQSTLDLDLTVQQNLNYHAALHGMNSQQSKQRIKEELERFNMYERRGEKVRQLNGGHRRRVEIARALLHQPAILLLDEPTVGLDVPSRQDIVDHVHRLTTQNNIAVLWATHLLDEIYPNDALVILHQGEIKAFGDNSSQILQKTGCTSIKEAFYQLTQKGASS